MNVTPVLLKNILSLIKKAGISEAKLLRECDIHRMFLTNWRNGTLGHPKFEDIYAISKYFNVTMDELANYKPKCLDIITDDNVAIEKEDINSVLAAYSKLDSTGRTRICSLINDEKIRLRNEKKFK